jgi:nitroreductase
MPLPSLTDLSELIRHRRSIKPASMDPARPVPEPMLMQCLENATWAPTHGLTQPWRFKIYTGDSRQLLAAALQLTYREVTSPASYREDKLAKLGLTPLQAPVVILCCMHRDPTAKIPEVEEIEAVACAAQNLMLSATAAGLGSYWSTPPVLETPEWRNWLGLGADDRCLGILYLGWAKPQAEHPSSIRQPVDSIAQWVS